MNRGCARKSRKSEEGGFILIFLVLLTVILLIGIGAFYAFAFADFNASLRNEWMTQAVYVAEAGIDKKLVQLGQNNTSNITGTLNFDSGGTYQGIYDVFYGIVESGAGGSLVAENPSDGTQKTVAGYGIGDEVIISTGTINLHGVERARRTIRVSVKKSAVVDPRSAVTIAGAASTNGNITIDGRDHDSNGNLTGGPGVYGVSTSSSTFTQSGNSKVGGNGIAPAKPANPATYEVNAPPLPPTPEAILGLSEGALDQYKTSTPPATPFHGIVYLTTNWTGVNFNGSSGILIVHNSTSTAQLKNLHDTFRGIIITDDIVHINGDAKIIGAVYGLKSDGVTLGNGSAEIKYSSAVLSSLPFVNYTVTSWQDSRND